MRFLVTALSIAALTSIIYPATAEVPLRRAGQPIWHVDDDNCPGPGSGTEADPFCLIQDCIDVAMDGDECVVAPGTYFENINFLGKAITLRSSDPGDPAVVAATTINAGDSGSVVTCEMNEGPGTVLHGFTITGGAGTEHEISPNRFRPVGGGMYNVNSSPTVTNCTFDGNSAYRGAGMYNTSSSPSVTHCTFSENTAVRGGGGMSNVDSSPTVTHCTFIGNTSLGGGMFNVDSSPTVTHCTFIGNTATPIGGGMLNFASSPMVSNCTFSGNSATSGGGMYCASGSSSTVTNCSFDGNSATTGGAILCSGSSPTISNCTFDWNSATDGGGMYCAGSSPTVRDCTFSMNTAESGGGMANDAGSDPTVANCVFDRNMAGEHGGGMINSSESTPVIIGCLFSENSAGLNGGGIHNIANSEDRPKVIGCRLVGNIARFGGGMYNQSTRLWAIDSEFIENTAILGSGGGMFSGDSYLFVANCTFRGNAATDTESAAQNGGVLGHAGGFTVTDRSRRAATVTTGWGGGMSNIGGTLVMTTSLFSLNSAKLGGGMFDGTSQSRLTNSTFSGNSATTLGGGILVDNHSSTMVSNCIIWDNAAAEGAELYLAGLLTIRYSDVAGGQQGVHGPGSLIWEEGNIEADPLFFDPARGNYRVSVNSPCIDSGDNMAVLVDWADLDGDGDTEEPTPYDLDGNPRFVDDPSMDDNGVGDPPVVDMGAYEFEGQLLAKLDIKPGSCPNPFNRHGNGVLSVALVGTAEFDASQVDLSTLQLSRTDGVGGSVAPNEGPPGPHSVLEDVATPFDGEGCECHDLGGDGIDDLSMKFKTRDLVDALELNDLSGGAVVELVLSGSLLDGTPFVAGDCIIIVPPGDLAPANAFVGSNVTDTFVSVTPIDLNFDGDGFADFSRSYYSGTALTLTAPLRSDGRRFVRWSVDGVLQEVGARNLELVVDQDISLRAIYERGRRPRPDRPTEDGGSVE